MTLQTFTLPEIVTGTPSDRALAQALVGAWRKDGILQLAKTPEQEAQTLRAFEANERFFLRPLEEKAQYVTDLSYSGYVVSGAEKKGDKQDFPEVFTVFPDIPADDLRVRRQIPGHGPVPWPSAEFRDAMTAYMDTCGAIGVKLLQLTALAMGLELDAFTRLAKNPWNHMRVLRFPAAAVDKPRGIGAHTDYGFFVISSQTDDQEGLFIRPPVEGEARPRNWMSGESMSGFCENVEPWNLIHPVKATFTAFPADMMQLVTGGHLQSTPHKVSLHPRPRRAMPVFIEPDFSALLRPYNDPEAEPLHYGSHITRMYMRAYADRVTTRRIVEEDRLKNLRLIAAATRAMY